MSGSSESTNFDLMPACLVTRAGSCQTGAQPGTISQSEWADVRADHAPVAGKPAWLRHEAINRFPSTLECVTCCLNLAVLQKISKVSFEAHRIASRLRRER